MSKRTRFSLVFPAVIFVCLSIGCQMSNSPSTPGIAQPNLTGSGNEISASNEFCWGLYDIAIDPESQSIDIVPLRAAMFEANVTKFLHPPLAPIDYLTISFQPGSNFPEGLAILDVSIRHPFPGTNFRGFDVMGIFMPPSGAQATSWDPSLSWPDENKARLLNPDGYTRWWNPVEFTTYGTIFGYQEGKKAVPGFASTSTLNAFKYFADGLDTEDPFDSEHLMGTDRGSFSTITPGFNKRRYEIQFPVTGPKPDWRFKYAITSSYYGPEGNYPPPAPVDDFPITANRAEAVLITPSDGGSTAFWENETTYGGDLVFNLEITDWQGLNNISGPVNEIGGIYAESPTLFSGVVDLKTTGITAYEPMNPTMMLTGCTIPNVTPTDVLGQKMLIIITSAEPSDYSVQIPGMTGFAYPENAILASFVIWDVPISSVGPQQNLPPVADASNTKPLVGSAPLDVSLDPSKSFDPDGVIVKYEWDIGNDGSFEYSTTMPDYVIHTFDTAGFYDVGLRVTDDDDAIDELDEPLVISVIDNEDPCVKGPNLICSGDGNVFVDEYVNQENNTQLFTNVINFDYGGPNSYNTIVKYYTGHGGTHNNSSITGHVNDIVVSQGYTLIDTNEEPIDTTDCRIIFVCLPGANGGSPFTQSEYDDLVKFIADGGRIVLTQEYSDGALQQQWGNDFLDAVGSTLERLPTSTTNQLHIAPIVCEAITNGVNMIFTPAYTSFQLGADDKSFLDDDAGFHVIVGDWL